jgi:hypothetical protein
MDAAQLAELNAVVASEARAWKQAGDTREDGLIIDDILARLPSIGPALYQMRRRANERVRVGASQASVVKIRARCFT